MMANETVTMTSSVGMSAAMRRNASFSMRGLYHLSRQAQFPGLTRKLRDPSTPWRVPSTTPGVCRYTAGPQPLPGNLESQEE